MSTTTISSGGDKTIEEELSLPILLAEHVRKAVGEAESFKSECAELGRQADLLSTMLRSAVRRLYEHPARCIAAEASKSLDRALSLVCRCRRSSVLRRVVSITIGSTDFRKALAHLEASLGDLRWLLSVYSTDDPSNGGGAGGIVVSLPPIASTDPILSWVWSCIATVQMAARPSDRVEAATSLANLTLDSGRNKKIIIKEGGVPPLLVLLRDGAASMDAQIAAATALSNLPPTMSWSPSSSLTSQSPSSSRFSTTPRCNSRHALALSSPEWPPTTPSPRRSSPVRTPSAPW